MDKVKQSYVIHSLDKAKKIFSMAYLFAQKLAEHDAVQLIVRPAKSKRTLEQNAKMWAMLTDIANQKQWVINGVLQTIKPAEWKDILNAALDQEMKVTQGINGGMVFLGKRTSQMSVKEMTDLIELMHAFGAEHNIKWSAPKTDFIFWEEAA
ncbi:recombination protein NinB [Entomomonas sp. E2T0]|uniref:recombination protein NinB n=1 Tax=Entomomonas sp. E2T0 TaxID=2930213 RepID=UPI0022284FC5|nr:recombination protein NinB [Entomomonas sp. E2T0]UYZ83181.1 recombination protein NinB [Entomomonas sp. E2T0]